MQVFEGPPDSIVKHGVSGQLKIYQKQKGHPELQALIDDLTRLMLSTQVARKALGQSLLDSPTALKFNLDISPELASEISGMNYPKQEAQTREQALNKMLEEIFATHYFFVRPSSDMPFESWSFIPRTQDQETIPIAGTLIFIPSQSPPDTLSLLHTLLHETAIRRDAKANYFSWLESSSSSHRLDPAIAAALTNNHSAIAFRMLRAFRFESDVLTELGRAYHVPLTTKLKELQNFTPETCNRLFGELLDMSFQNQWAQRGINDDKLDEIKRVVRMGKMGTRRNGLFGEQTQNVCLFWSLYDLSGATGLNIGGPRPRVDGW